MQEGLTLGSRFALDLADQPAALARVLDVNALALDDARGLVRSARSVRLLAIGSSRHAAGVGAAALEDAGVRADVPPAPGAAVPAPVLRADDVVVVVSQSGETPALVTAARRARSLGCRVVTVTNAGGTLARLADVALDQYERFHFFSEDDTPLANQIRKYWTDIGKTFPGVGTAWSAVFISWCAQKAGAAAAEFPVSARHSEFINAFIRNTLNQTGVFRAVRLNEYGPSIGDIIHNNREGNTFDYDFAARRTTSAWRAGTSTPTTAGSTPGARSPATELDRGRGVVAGATTPRPRLN